MALGQLDGCEMGLTLESEEGEVPHLRWSQAPPLPWPRPGSADFETILTYKNNRTYSYIMPHASCFLIVTSQCDICPHKHDLDAIQMMSNFCIFFNG